MKNKFLYMFLFALMFFVLIPANALAVCPACTVAVSAGVGLSRWLGIDDTITGLWIGGFLVSIIIWTINWLSKKTKFKAMPALTTFFYYAIIIFTLITTNIIGHPENILWGIDKLILGIFIGSVFFLIGSETYKYIKMRNKNRAWFPFQKVVMPILPLIILTIIFYFITR